MRPPYSHANANHASINNIYIYMMRCVLQNKIARTTMSFLLISLTCPHLSLRTIGANILDYLQNILLSCNTFPLQACAIELMKKHSIDLQHCPRHPHFFSFYAFPGRISFKVRPYPRKQICV